MQSSNLGAARRGFGFALCCVLASAFMVGVAPGQDVAVKDLGAGPPTGPGAAAARTIGTAPAKKVAALPDVQLVTVDGQKQMLSKPGTDAVGAAKPDVVIVEYFDYNCPYCKSLVGSLHALIAQDPKIAVLYKDWPILGDVSVYASISALAARWQGKYQVAHDALVSGPRLAKNEQVDAILQGAGVNLATLEKDRTAHAKEIAALLARNDDEAHALSLQGTPGIVVGRQLVAGIVDLSTLKQLVANSRKQK
jgi:protein-disulfide isomerase